MLKRIILIAVALMFIGCAIGPKTACPPEDAYYIINLPNGQKIPVFVEKDWFNKRRDMWKNQEEFNKFMQEYRKKTQGY